MLSGDPELEGMGWEDMGSAGQQDGLGYSTQPFLGVLGRAVLTGIAAVFRDEEKLHAYRGPGASKSSIDIYSCAGKLIRSINVRSPAARTSASATVG